MINKQNLLFGKLAVADKVITNEQLRNYLEKRKESNALPMTLLQEKVIDEKNLRELLLKYLREVQKANMQEPGEALVLCRSLLQEEILSPDVIIEMRIKEEEYSMSYLLLKNNYISVRKFLDIYLNLDKETLDCPGCEKTFRLVRLVPGKKIRCKHCKTIFNVPTIEHEISLYSSEDDIIDEKRENSESEIPEEIANYQLLEKVAEGGMGIIYRAQKKETGHVVALKILREAHRTSTEAKERFKREALTLKQKLAKHKNIITVLDVGIDKSIPFFTMEFIEGNPLSTLIEERSLNLERMVEILIKLCDGLNFAHTNGVIHRDIKPSNILLNMDEEPYITDFGLAKCMDSMTLVTRSGSMLGTPYYMSPEQAKGQLGLVGPRSDIYGLGVVFYEMLTGENPFKGENTIEIYQNILTANPSPPSKLNSKVPSALDEICLKCLRKNPFHRYKTAEELENDLIKYQKGELNPGFFKRLLSKIFGKKKAI